MKVPINDLHFLKAHAVKIEGVWRCEKTGFRITFEERSSFLKLKHGERYERVALLTFIHCPRCNPGYILPPVEETYSDEEIVEFEGNHTSDYTSEDVTTGYICPT